jgi:hypothetical protein
VMKDVLFSRNLICSYWILSEFKRCLKKTSQFMQLFFDTWFCKLIFRLHSQLEVSNTFSMWEELRRAQVFEFPVG